MSASLTKNFNVSLFDYSDICALMLEKHQIYMHGIVGPDGQRHYSSFTAWWESTWTKKHRDTIQYLPAHLNCLNKYTESRRGELDWVRHIVLKLNDEFWTYLSCSGNGHIPVWVYKII